MSYSGSVSAQRTLVVSSGVGYTGKRTNMATREVTVHQMVSSTSTSAVLINTGYLKTFPGILKVFQIILGCIICGIIGHYIPWTRHSEYLIPELLFLLIAASCLIATSLLLFSCLCSISTAAVMPKTLFETQYHIVATCLYCASSIYLIVYLTKNEYYVNEYVPKVAANAIGLVNTVLYLISSIYSVRTFRRG